MYNTEHSTTKRPLRQRDLPLNRASKCLRGISSPQLAFWDLSAERTSPTMARIEPDDPALPIRQKLTRTTFSQEWRPYNLAQTNEKQRFEQLLYDLCSGINEPEQTFGRPRVLLADIVFSATLKAYTMVSGRRNTGAIKEAYDKGYVSKVLHYNTISKYLERERLTEILTNLIEESAIPLKTVELHFAPDSTGFSTGIYRRWSEVKWGAIATNYANKEPSARVRNKEFVKLHIATGVKTNIVTAAKVTKGFASDCKEFEYLIERTNRNFSIRSVFADKAYSSYRNVNLVVMKGGTPYIPFKTNARAHNRSPESWKRMFHLYNYQQAEFMRQYHQRSNVETTMSMIKKKFGDRLRGKVFTAQANELLCKVLCHNICCVIQSIYELGIEASFWQESNGQEES